jgi:hypothetical protein
MDLYDVKFFSSLVSYLRSSYFYGVISGILGYKIETKDIPTKVGLGSVNQSSTGNKESIKISD